MKKLKKVAVGMLVLALLFSPTATHAGSEDRGWFESIRSFFQDRSPRFGTDRDRPTYNPYTNGRPGCPPSIPARDRGNSVPINGGLVFLLVAGVGLGAKRVHDLKRLRVQYHS